MMTIKLEKLKSLIEFSESSTGGGCMALWSTDINTNQYYFLITDIDGDSIPQDGEPVLIGLYDGDGQQVEYLETDDTETAENFINHYINIYGY